MNPKELLKRIDLPADRLDEEVAKIFAATDTAEGYGESVGSFSTDTILKGRVLDIMNADVIVDVGYKSEGVISKSEFENPEEIDIGDEVEVLLEAHVQVPAALERDPRHRRPHQVAAPHRHRPRDVRPLEHVEVGEQRVARRRQAERDAGLARHQPVRPAEVELRHRTARQRALAVIGERRLQEARLVDRELRAEPSLAVEVHRVADVVVRVRVDAADGKAVGPGHADVGRARVEQPEAQEPVAVQ